MSVKFSFNADKIIKDIKKDIEKNPQIILNQNVGKRISAECPKCHNNSISIVRQGYGVCDSCKAKIKIDLNINWR